MARQLFLQISILISLLGPSLSHSDAPTPGNGFIMVEGGPIWYEVGGEGEGVPLVTLHGGPGGRSCGFDRFYDAGMNRPIVRYDQLGTGRSGRPNDLNLWTVERYVEELHSLRAELGLDEIHLLGHSWGGALAGAYVLEKGTEGIASIIFSSPLLSTPAWIEDANFLRSQLPPDVQQVLDEHEAAGTIDSDEYQRATAVFYSRHVTRRDGEPRTPNPDCAGQVGNDVIYNYMWGATEFNATGTLLDFDLTPRLHEIDVPVLFMAGEYDEARPARMREFSQLIPDSKLVIIPDAAHSALGTKTKDYISAVREFLNGVDPVRP
ncbi:MAG: proline iminopeptidase-family hydrolase [Gammaproteobacteria bacterium]|nr:proline iminopeptidase-family hydrolase [Gammaproteobacteria bacterium]MDD9896107.1 proline iminopeptidase-family hydrolase [Gammaproteobacteria bacterium]MDD9959126.1 proline iminopeptidase-family hydrolase [Gammaproteobacteria bacterium]